MLTLLPERAYGQLIRLHNDIFCIQISGLTDNVRGLIASKIAIGLPLFIISQASARPIASALSCVKRNQYQGGTK